MARRVGFRAKENYGAALENLVFLELLKSDPSTEIYYYSTPEGYEVDFVLFKKPEVVQLIQVCYAFESEKTRRREERALIKAGKELGLKICLYLHGMRST